MREQQRTFTVVVEETEFLGLCHLEATEYSGEPYKEVSEYTSKQMVIEDIPDAINAFLYGDAERFKRWWK